ncbi:MAG TPA: MFS transporter [Actinocrinis sp.]|jgi:MFS family permease
MAGFSETRELESGVSAAAAQREAEAAEAAETLFSPRHLAVTVGFVSAVLLIAFEAMAVSTAMPIAVADLHGLAFYSLAFSAYLTLSLLGMVLAGQRADARGPRLPLLGGLALFCAGLLLAGTATTMVQFVAGRSTQGLGGGMVIVALYVLVADAYPERLHGKAFSAFATCWVLPGLVGPFVSGVLTEDLSWRWVFLGVAVLVALPLSLLVRSVRRLPPRERPQRTEVESARLRTVRICALLASLGVGLFQLGSQELNLIGALLVPVALVLLVPSAPKLLPAGLFRAGRGLPTVIALRGLLAGSYMGIEAFIPLMLVTHRHFSPTRAGLSLTLAAISWAIAAWLVNRPGVQARIPRAGMLRIGIAITAVSLVGDIVAIDPRTPWWTAAAAMFCAAFGMGFAFTNISVLTLELAGPGEEGAASSALQVSDGMSSTLSIAVAGAIYHAVNGSSGTGGAVFVVMFSTLIGLACLAWLIAPRVRTPGTRTR